MKINKEAKKFMQDRKKDMKRAYKLLRPSIYYCKEFDILYLSWGQKKVHSTIELSEDCRMDITKDGLIIGIEIEEFSVHQKENKI